MDRYLATKRGTKRTPKTKTGVAVRRARVGLE